MRPRRDVYSLGNEEADRIANSSVLHTTVAYIKQRASQSINEARQRRVRGLVRADGTKLLEVYPVSHILTAFFKSTPREIFGCITQILTGHGYTEEYYKRMHLEESPWCPCSHDYPDAPVLMTRLRILQECARYH